MPSQTWPNRAFLHAGTSNGHVDNGTPPDPMLWNVPTIFNVLTNFGASWGVYSDAILVQSLTRTMFPKLWDPLLDRISKTSAPSSMPARPTPCRATRSSSRALFWSQTMSIRRMT